MLSPPRSGSTLLRVMLAGHPSLFAPPELELLSFNNMRDRKRAFSGRHSFWLEGATRAVMEVHHCDAAAAKEIIQPYEDEGVGTREFYQRLQTWIGTKTLVDKSPSYALDLEILRRGEAYFEDALYIHLLRHPKGMIRSFLDSRLDEVFFLYQHLSLIHI